MAVNEKDKRREESGTSGVDRRSVLRGIGAAGTVSVLGFTGTAGAQGDQVLNLAQVKSPLEFDPIVLNDVPSAQVAGRIFEGLYRYDQSTTTVPELAAGEAKVSNGGKTYVVEIKEGATFQNGDPVTAEDVKYSFEAPVNEETENVSEVNMIDTVTAEDQRTVRFDLKYPFGAFNHTLTWSIVPKNVREQDKEAFNTKKPVGSGPFEFDNWQEGNFAKISRWEDYWGEPKPQLAGIRFVPIEEPTTRVTTLRNGENDVIEEIPPKLYPQVRGMGDASIEEVLGIGYFYLAFNCKNGPTADPEVREAIDYTFSMDQAVSNFIEPTGERQYSPLPQPVVEEWGMPVDKWKQIPHDKNVDKAKSMLDGSDSVPDDWNAKIIVPPDDKREQIGVTVANGLKEAGYNANVQRLDWGAFLDKYVSGDPNDYNMYTLGWSGVPDPDSFTYYFFAEESHGVTDGTFYGKISDQIVSARESNDRAERKQLYVDAITTMLQDRAHLSAYNLKNSFGVKQYVQDFAAHPVGSFTVAEEYANTSLSSQ
ncbi:ABC transporter substrate-binding protein [halophilic archaeon]|nr:ABC transporter substrate-binding protein [halophilic archaeon]